MVIRLFGKKDRGITRDKPLSWRDGLESGTVKRLLKQKFFDEKWQDKVRLSDAYQPLNTCVVASAEMDVISGLSRIK